MKIRRQAHIVIGTIVAIPVIFILLFLYLLKGEVFAFKEAIIDGVKQVYSCAESGKWEDFNLEESLVQDVFIYSIKIIKDDEVVFEKHFNPDESNRTKLSSEKYMRSIATYEWRLNEVEEEFKSRLEDFPSFGKYNVTVFVTSPTYSLYGSLNVTKKVALIGILCTILGIILSGSLFIVTLTRTINAMEIVLKGWEKNDFEVKIPLGCNDEVAALVQNFNNAGKKIHENVALKERFIMGLSHDFKTPLALIRGYSELLHKDIPAENETANKHLACIESNTEQLEIMLYELLDFISLENGEIPLAMEETDLVSWLNFFIRRVKNDATLVGKEINGKIDLHNEIFVKMDVRLVDRAMTNIIQNALRYTDKDGKILIEAFQSESSITIQVSDNGPGINKKDIPHVFEMFYRSSPERDKKGMGIGLSVVQTLINVHGWEIRVENIKPHGACFIITIPLKKY